MRTYEKTFAVYVIKNTINGRLYVGATTMLRERWNLHRRELRRGKHRSARLQQDWNKHPEHVFALDILEPILDESQLREREQYWISLLQPYYNMTPFAIGGKASKSPETRQKISEALKGREVPWMTPEVQARAAATRTGVKRGPYKSHRHNPASNVGRPTSEATKQKLSEIHKGREMPWLHTPEAKARRAAAMNGKKRGPYKKRQPIE